MRRAPRRSASRHERNLPSVHPIARAGDARHAMNETIAGSETIAMNETIAGLVRRHDPDRFLTALFAPPARRDALLTLYAFDLELARAREATSEPHLTLIRLHWWREVVEGAHRRHEVATALATLLDQGLLTPD